MREFAKSHGWAAAIGASVGVFEALDLLASGFAPTLGDLLAILALYALLGLGFGVAGAIPLRLLLRTGRASKPTAEKVLAVAPPASAVFGLLLLEMLGRALPPLAASSRTQMYSLGLFLVVAGGAWVWSIRISGSRAATGVRRLFWSLLVVASVVAVAWSIRPSGLRESSPDSVRADASLPDLVLIVIDTLRADHLGSYGYPRPVSPFLDGLAEAGLVFDSAYATSNWTRPSVASLLTSTLPSEHGVTRIDRRVPDGLLILPEVLARVGYRVGVFSGNVNVHPEDGYDRGVARFEIPRRPLVERTTLGSSLSDLLFRLVPSLQYSTIGREVQINPDDLVERALDWVGSVEADAPVFLYLHFIGPHDPYEPPEHLARELTGRAPERSATDPPKQWAGDRAVADDLKKRMIEQYDGEILWHDRAIADLVESLADLGRLETAWLAITSDHGEGFGEHGTWTHGHGLFQELTRIPLILWRSGESPSRRVDTPVSLLDVAPTLLDLAGVPSPDSYRGRSLAGYLRGEEPAGERAILFENPDLGEFGILAEGWYFIRGNRGRDRVPHSWLFRAEDRLQLDPQPLDQNDAALRLGALLDAHLEQAGAVSRAEDLDLDEERLKALRALGYVQ